MRKTLSIRPGSRQGEERAREGRALNPEKREVKSEGGNILISSISINSICRCCLHLRMLVQARTLLRPACSVAWPVVMQGALCLAHGLNRGFNAGIPTKTKVCCEPPPKSSINVPELRCSLMYGGPQPKHGTAWKCYPL